MSLNAFHRAIYLTGPTASGKTAVGIAVAHRLGAEVIALDSMTLYRGMDIGTAKPTPAERDEIPHHLIDIIDPWESSSVAMYRESAREAIQDVANRGRPAIFVGGTPLYLKALLRGLFQGPGANTELRQRLEREADSNGDARFTLDWPRSTERPRPDSTRTTGDGSCPALEVFELTGKPISVLQAEHDRPALLMSASSRSNSPESAFMTASIIEFNGFSILDWLTRFGDCKPPPPARHARSPRKELVTARSLRCWMAR